MASSSVDDPGRRNLKDANMTDCSPFSLSWASLPVDIICSILSYLPLTDRVKAGLTCRSWYSAFQQPSMWQDFTFNFCQPRDQRILACLDMYGPCFKSVTVCVNQFVENNRTNALTVFEKLTAMDSRRLTSLTVGFVGQNPLFYAGSEFVNAVHDLFIKEVADDKIYGGLLRVDLSKFTAAFDDKLLRALCWKNVNLSYLNIQTQCLVSKVTSEGMLALIKGCHKLKDLRVIYCSLTDEVLEELASGDRMPLEHLSVVCRREEKYRKELSNEAWGKLARSCPQLRVTLKFDNTCPLYKVSLIMKPDIPVENLLLETFTHIEKELNVATSYYSSTVKCVVLQTRNSAGLGRALVGLAQNCPGLSCLKVYCVLNHDTVNKILELCPVMRESNNYILKWQPQDEPWVVGQECGD